MIASRSMMAPLPAPVRAPAPAPRAYPVRVSLCVSEVVGAGLATLLRPWPDRVEVLADGERGRAQVDVFEPDDRGHPRNHDGVPRVALAWDQSPGAVARARELGAVRVVPLSVDAPGLLHVLEQVHRDGATATPAEDQPAGGLSPREADVVRGICQGWSNAEIAERLDLSINSVKTYVRTAYRKMGVSSRSQAVLWGVARGL